LGATLARLEARAALDALLALPDLRLGGGDVDVDIEMIDSFVLRGPRALTVEWDRSPTA
jgi:cytochrome P450